MATATGHHDEIELYTHLQRIHFGRAQNEILKTLTLEQLGRLHDEEHTPNRSYGHHISDLSVTRDTGGQA
jgi:hypothetical protein